MNQKTLFKLEYDKIIALLEKEATSFRGGQLCRRLKPMTDLHKINTYQEQTAAAYTRIVQKGKGLRNAKNGGIMSNLPSYNWYIGIWG